MAISKLTSTDTINASTLLAGSVNSLDRSFTMAVLTAYLQGVLTTSSEKVTQHSAPSATGFSVQVSNTTDNTWLILTPTAGFAAGTIVLPLSTVATDKQELLVNCTQAVTALTINGNGATVTGAPTALLANDSFLLRFDSVTSTWYKVG